MHPTVRERCRHFCDSYGLRVPILMAPMAGACPAPLAAAVADAGGMGGGGCVAMGPDEIAAWAGAVRGATNGAFQLNLWVPDPDPVRDPAQEAQVRAFLAGWGPEVADPGEIRLPDFEAQCAALLAAGPAVVSSIMGLYPPDFVAALKARGIRWFATVTTVAEAVAAEAAGADAVIAQGMEAGGHRGTFEGDAAESALVGLVALVPAVADAVSIPVIATGGIADGRGVAAALVLGASAVQVGTALLRSPEAALPPSYAALIGATPPEGTRTTRAFSGRLGRSLRTRYAEAAAAPSAPRPAPFPVQRALTAPMRTTAEATDDVHAMSAWAGQSARLARPDPAREIVERLWTEAQALLGPDMAP